MHPLDYAVLVLYLAVLIGKSVFLARRAARGSAAYFLAGKKMPWWALGASGMSSNLDAAGTMTIVALIYTFGLHGFFIEMRGGVVLPIAVFLAFMGKWHQRSDVVTTGEWMHLRFGTDAPGKAARFTAALTYLVITVGMVVFFVAAAGKFLAVFLPFDETTCQVAMAVLALAYTMISGLYGVVWTDVMQAGLIGFAAVYVAVLAATYVSPELIDQWPGAAYNSAVPVVGGGLVEGGTEAYAPFLLFLLFWAGKGVLEGLGGSGGSAYMAQRFYASQDVPTVKKLCMLWTVLFAFRWPMVLGFVILGIHLGIGQRDPELVLTGVLGSDLFPVGVKGLLITAIFAASMSTFDSTINAGASYVVRDVLLPLRPGANERTQVVWGYLASAGIVAAGLTLALLFAEGIVDLWVTIVIQLFPAFLIPFALRWFWARFNGWGFTAGVAAGFAAAFGWTFVQAPEALESYGVFVQNGAFTDIAILGSVGLVSLLGCLVGTYATRPVKDTTLRRFYDQIKPFGVWPRGWKQPDAAEHRGDVLRLLLALTWQVSTFLLPMLAMLRMWTPLAVLGVVWLVTGSLLLRDAFNDRPNAADPK
ncbi:MAG: sodium:solute symporter [Planctomycetota bacterium]